MTGGALKQKGEAQMDKAKAKLQEMGANLKDKVADARIKANQEMDDLQSRLG